MNDTITVRTGYRVAVRAIETAVAAAVADNPELEGREDEVWADMAASMLTDASEDVGREVCRTQLGYVPQALDRYWKKRRAVDAVTAAQREEMRKTANRKEAERQRNVRARKAAAARVEARQTLVASLCSRCFTVPAANGRCNC